MWFCYLFSFQSRLRLKNIYNPPACCLLVNSLHQPQVCDLNVVLIKPGGKTNPWVRERLNRGTQRVEMYISACVCVSVFETKLWWEAEQQSVNYSLLSTESQLISANLSGFSLAMPLSNFFFLLWSTAAPTVSARRSLVFTQPAAAISTQTAPGVRVYRPLGSSNVWVRGSIRDRLVTFFICHS